MLALFRLCCKRIALDLNLTSQAMEILPLDHVVQCITDYAVEEMKTLELRRILRTCQTKRLMIRVQDDSSACLHAAMVVSSCISSMCRDRACCKLNTLDMSQCACRGNIENAEKSSLLLAKSLLKLSCDGKDSVPCAPLHILTSFVVSVKTRDVIQKLLSLSTHTVGLPVQCSVTAVTFCSVDLVTIRSVLRCLAQEHVHQIDVGFIGMGDSVLEELLSLIISFDQLQFFGFAYNNLRKDSTVEKLCDVISHLPDLEGIDCSGNVFPRQHNFLPRLLSSFHKMPSNLVLSCLGQRAIRSLLVERSSLTGLREVVLSGNNLVESCDVVEQILLLTPYLRLLDLSGNGFGQENILHLIGTILSLKQLQVIILNQASCSINCLVGCVELLTALPRLQRVQFHDTNIPIEDINSEADSFGLTLNQDITLKREVTRLINDRLISARHEGSNAVVSFNLSGWVNI